MFMLQQLQPKQFPSTESPRNHAHSRYFSTLNTTVASPSLFGSLPGSRGPIPANCWGGMCRPSQVQRVSQITAVPEAVEREITSFYFTPFSSRAVEYKFQSILQDPGEISS